MGFNTATWSNVGWFGGKWNMDSYGKWMNMADMCRWWRCSIACQITRMGSQAFHQLHVRSNKIHLFQGKEYSSRAMHMIENVETGVWLWNTWLISEFTSWTIEIIVYLNPFLVGWWSSKHISTGSPKLASQIDYTTVHCHYSLIFQKYIQWSVWSESPNTMIIDDMFVDSYDSYEFWLESFVPWLSMTAI